MPRRSTLLSAPRLARLAAATLLVSVVTSAWASAAQADFRLCNRTGSRVGVAIGYKGPDGWVTEGWWNLTARSCETLLTGPLVSRYYYVYALDYDRGGEWGGKAFMCTQERLFTIKGVEDCVRRGFERTGFFEVDTADQRNWTVQLTDATTPRAEERPQTQAAPGPGPNPAIPGFAPGPAGGPAR